MASEKWWPVREPLLLAILCASAWSTASRADEVPTVRVGSKSFTESVVLGEVISHLARQSGAKVVHRAELGGTQILWKALLAGEIDVYVDYTGTISEEICPSIRPAVGKPADETQMRQLLAANGIVMSERIGFNNTYALGMRREVAERLSIDSISQLKGYPNLNLGLSDEFMERHDGWYALAERYQLPQSRVRTMDHNLAYRGLVHGAIEATDLYTTDAEIKSYDLRVLNDDLGFFPTYHAVVLLRDDLRQHAPQAVRAIERLEGLIQPQEMAAMTAAVINVGTATIGALIGAGGYGAPILTGIRLSSIPLILQGAIPAALMAVAVQFGFGLLEQRLVSPGLRPKC